jgi:hypothetical protein
MEIELQDGTVLDAPDGLSPEQIKSLVVNYTRKNKWGAWENINNTVNQIGTGVYKGLAGVAALPRTLSDLLADRSTAKRHPVAGRGIPGAEKYVKTEIDPTEQNPGQKHLATADELLSMLESGTLAGTKALGLPESLAFKRAPVDTDADRYLQATGVGLSGVFLPGGAAANASGGVAGSLGSEAAGDLTEGTAAEPYARVLGALIPGYAASAMTNKLAASNVEQIIARATIDATDDQWNAAMRLQAEAAARGTPITSAEAMAQIQGGNRSLMSIQRTVEQMPQTERQMGQFMSARPAGNEAAVAGQMDDIAPRVVAPTEIGPRIQQGAQNYVGGIRQDINAETEMPYWLSQFDRVPQREFARISQTPAFQNALQAVRNDPLLGPPLTGMADDSVAVINAVKKEMDEMGTRLSNYTSPAYSPERSMRVEQARTPVVDAATNASPAYRTALETQATRRAAELAPAERAPIGQLAQTDDASAQAKILLPTESLKASPEQIGGTVRELVNQGRADDVASLLRATIQDVYAKSVSNVKGMGEQLRGAQFANNLLKNQNQYASLEAAVRQLPDGETTWNGLRRLLDVFEAQGQRLMPGSPTSFNQQLAESLSQNLGKGVKSFGTDMWANWNVQRRSQELARILTAPEGVALLRQLAVLGPNTARAQQLVQGFYQGGQAIEPSRRLLKKAP